MSDAGLKWRQPRENLCLLICDANVPHTVAIRNVERMGIMRVVSVAGRASIAMMDIGMRHFIPSHDVVGVRELVVCFRPMEIE